MTSSVTEIPKSWVDETWNEIGAIQDEINAVSLSQLFVKKQPDLSEYILSLSQDLSKEACELAYYIGFIIWRCYEGYFDGKLRKITSDEVINQHEKTDKWLESLEDVDSLFLIKRISNKTDYEQQYILQYIVEAIFESRGDEINLTPEEESSLFIILKVHMDCLDLAVRTYPRCKKIYPELVERF